MTDNISDSYKMSYIIGIGLVNNGLSTGLILNVLASALNSMSFNYKTL